MNNLLSSVDHITARICTRRNCLKANVETRISCGVVLLIKEIEPRHFCTLPYNIKLSFPATSCRCCLLVEGLHAINTET